MDNHKYLKQLESYVDNIYIRENIKKSNELKMAYENFKSVLKVVTHANIVVNDDDIMYKSDTDSDSDSDFISDSKN